MLLSEISCRNVTATGAFTLPLANLYNTELGKHSRRTVNTNAYSIGLSFDC